MLTRTSAVRVGTEDAAATTNSVAATTAANKVILMNSQVFAHLIWYMIDPYEDVTINIFVYVLGWYCCGDQRGCCPHGTTCHNGYCLRYNKREVLASLLNDVEK